jgi:hypothetical protein
MIGDPTGVLAISAIDHRAVTLPNHDDRGPWMNVLGLGYDAWHRRS